MAETTQYDVVANLVTKGGGASGGVPKLVEDAKKLESGWTQMGAGLDRMLGGATAFASTLGSIATTAITIGGAAAGAMLGAAGVGASYIGKAMSELEGKSIQLASVLAAATGTPFDVMQKQSMSLFEQFRQDAITSAGETADFVDVAAKIAGPLAGAGRSMDDLHRITKGVVEMAPSLGIAFDQAGSDVMRMLQGTAGIESPLFRAMVAIPSLGIAKAEEFNKLSPEKRIAKIEQALTNPAFRAAAASYGDSWAGLISTFEDASKAAGMKLGEPLFGLAKRGIAALNNGVMAFAQGSGGERLHNLGVSLRTDFENIAHALGRIFPSFEASSAGAVGILETLTRGPLELLVDGSRWVADHWGEIKNGAREASIYIHDAADRAIGMVKALGGGDLQTGLKRAGELALAMKAAQLATPVATMASGAVGIAGGAARVLGGIGASAGAAAATGAATGTAAAASGGAGAAAAGGGLAAAAGPLAIALAAAGGAVALFKMNIFGLSTKMEATWDRIGTASGKLWTSLQGLGASMWKLGEAAMPLIALLGTQLYLAVGILSGAVELLVKGLTALSDGLTWVIDKAVLAINNAKKMLFGDTSLGPTADTADEEKRESAITNFAPTLGDTTVNAMREAFNPMKKPPPPDKSKTHVVVEIKWDLGEGNEDAIFIKTKKAIADTLRDAQSVQRTSRMRGA